MRELMLMFSLGMRKTSVSSLPTHSTMAALSNYSSLGILSLCINTIIGLVNVNASLFVAIFRFDYLPIGKRHRQITHLIGILSIAYQIILQIYLVTYGEPNIASCVSRYIP